ncbi:MAG TPA: hypothetical protein VG096_10600 [Bryobacteraceae bacterium]|jgi:hypothetical protein|nr:hypothetical protein [Bryobacteraceae bacterium]
MPATALAPQTSEAFVLDCFFNTATTDSTTAPTPTHGLTIPNGWGPGYKSWTRGWRVNNPNVRTGNPFFNPALRQLRVQATNPASNYFQAAGNPFTINAWNLQPAAVTNAIVQVSASYVNGSGATIYTNPPISNFCWGLYNSGALLDFPDLQGSQEYVQIAQPSGSLPVSVSENAMYVGGVATLVFDNPITAPPVGTRIHLTIAVYLTLAGTAPNSPPALQWFDDPDMDIDMGTNK